MVSVIGLVAILAVVLIFTRPNWHLPGDHYEEGDGPLGVVQRV